MKHLILTLTIIMTMTIRATEIDRAQLSRVMRAIAQVESSNRDIGVHPDGVSYGKYGVTAIAMKELQRLEILSPNMQKEWLLIPETNEIAARQYLMLMFNRHGKCWYKAVGWYHGGDANQREEYANKVYSHLTNK